MHDVADLIDTSFLTDVLMGLSGRQKSIPCRWFYDDRGSELFEDITRLAEYYPTRTETGIIQDNIQAIAGFAGSEIALLEYGAGAGIKTELLLEKMDGNCLYVPIDIAGDFLNQTVDRIRAKFPALRVRPITSDFTIDFDIPDDVPTERRVGFFPGSTIGNLSASEARTFLGRMRRHVGRSGAAIIGVDLKKDIGTIIAAYDDSLGVTAAFNLNLLTRINRELGGNFRPDLFEHRASWNETDGAVEMHLVSRVEQSVTLADHRFQFEAGETIHTESSRKYDPQSFAALADGADWVVDRTWMDADRKFAIFGLRPKS
ncbi:MAG: egtD [Rubritepida sp.]|nr:egtD [Rubritepida sp.]